MPRINTIVNAANDFYLDMFQDDIAEYAVARFVELEISSLDELESYADEFSAGEFDAFEYGLSR